MVPHTLVHFILPDRTQALYTNVKNVWDSITAKSKKTNRGDGIKQFSTVCIHLILDCWPNDWAH